MTAHLSGQRVAFNDLSYEQDSRYHHAGVWFTGWTYSEYRGFKEEQGFRYGFRWGPARVYNQDGRLIQETNFRMDLLYGFEREWDDEGRLQRELFYEHGILLKEQEWDESGSLVKDFQRPTDCPHVLEMRRLYGTPEQVEAEESDYWDGDANK